jgi:Na+-transporting NADH:ubiquinone oxidoreductase subunit C
VAEAKSGKRSRDSVSNTLIVAVSLSLVCAVLVAGTAVFLKPRQLQNEADYRQRIILEVAGLYEPGVDPGEAFAGIDARMVELATGQYVDQPSVQGFDAQAAAADPDFGTAIPASQDLAGIRRRAKFAPVYLVRDGDELQQVILPVYGSGLWSTMYGYLALEADGRTVRGLRFYSHAETPGLGDQIDKPAWLAQWRGRKLFDDSGAIRIEVIRGTVAEPIAGIPDDTKFQVDGLAGATLTGRGVTNLVHYWVGEHGFGPYLEQLQSGEERQP